jgi:hypothetical protein
LKNIFSKNIKKNLAASGNYFHLCTTNNKHMQRIHSNIETAKGFSPLGDYTAGGACKTVE